MTTVRSKHGLNVESGNSGRKRRGLGLLFGLLGAFILAGGAAILMVGPSKGAFSSDSLDALSLAKIALVDGDFSRAKALLEPRTDRAARLLLGRVMVESGRVIQAKEIYGEFLKDDPQEISALRGLGRVHRELGQIDMAIAYYRRASKFRPKDAAIWKELGLAQREKGDLLSALISFQESLSLDEHQPVLSNLVTKLAIGQNPGNRLPAVPGIANIRRGRPEDADLDRFFVERRPPDPARHFPAPPWGHK